MRLGQWPFKQRLKLVNVFLFVCVVVVTKQQLVVAKSFHKLHSLYSHCVRPTDRLVGQSVGQLVNEKAQQEFPTYFILFVCVFFLIAT